MEVVKLGDKINTPVIICLGYFGCMHKGHTEILGVARKIAEEKGAKVALFTFSNNHLAVLGKDDKVLYTFDERLQIYRSLGVDYVIESVFDSRFRNLMGSEYLQTFVDNYDLKGVVCGFDHRCGSDRMDCRGVAEFLHNVCPTQIVGAVCVNGVKVSTTLIKSYIKNHEIASANALLSEPYFVCGNVVDGRGVGKKIGFPTANVQVPSEKLLPCGVFGGVADVCGKQYRCIVNIGATPTFNRSDTVVEAHLLGYDGDLYGKTVKIALTKYLRGITKFASADELAEQLRKDKEAVAHD